MDFELPPAVPMRTLEKLPTAGCPVVSSHNWLEKFKIKCAMCHRRKILVAHVGSRIIRAVGRKYFTDKKGVSGYPGTLK